jgi:predicted enzyme related to lactoylglutathione lyase
MDTTTYSTIKKMSPLFLVTDLERSIDFYMKTLGFDLDFRYQDFYAGIVKDGWSIHLKSGSPVREERKSKRDNGDTDIVFSVDAIDELYDQLSNKSLEIVQPLREMPYGKEFYIADPDGYILAFLEG